MRILLTGATGFLGSHIAETLLRHEVKLMIVKRKTSSLDYCAAFINDVQIVDLDESFWISQVCSFSPEIIIHSAWTGVVSNYRNDWQIQLSNVEFVNSLLYIAEKCNIAKFIALGSQAEYGEVDGIVSESEGLYPVNNYGRIKTLLSRVIGSFCDLHGIDWFWLRIFSVYGERESNQWLIPSVINKILADEKGMDFTLGQQKYAYLYVKDLAGAVAKVCFQNATRGIYNISASVTIELRELIKSLRDKLNPNFELRFGTLPYRSNQSMLVQGDISKFVKSFGQFEHTPLNTGIDYTIAYYKKQYEII